MIRDDWFLRQVDDMCRAIASIIFGRENASYTIENIENKTAADALSDRLIMLIDRKKFNEAENLLFDSIDENDLNYLLIAMDFYRAMAKESDDALEANGFSREEILDGMKEIQKIYNIII